MSEGELEMFMARMAPQRTVRRLARAATVAAAALALLTPAGTSAQAPAAPAGQAPAAGGGRGAPPPDPTKPHRLDVTQGTRARYKAQEQFVGIDFPSQAVGTTETITGMIIVKPDGSFDPASKITVDLRTLTSDQAQRDNFIQGRTLETEKFPNLELVPRRAMGLPAPLPASQQAGFKMVTDMTMHGVTKEVTWTVVSTFSNDAVNGRATTTVDFAMFNMTKPTLARLMSVEDKIELEVEFRFRRSVVQ
jgi:polyisoprenoid-binding protein YceI